MHISIKRFMTCQFLCVTEALGTVQCFHSFSPMKRLLFGRPSSARIQFLRYVFVGGSAAVIHLSSFHLLMEILGLHYLIANVVSFIFSWSWNYAISLLWVFESKHKRGPEALMVLLISFGGLMWNQLLLYLFVEFGSLHPLLANIIATWIVLGWNFSMRKAFVFHQRLVCRRCEES